MSALEARALAFATEAHGEVGQVRKYTGEPYIVHPIAVAEIVRSVPHTPEMIAAALLHDTVEDTFATITDIEREFGEVVAQYVHYLTDVSRPGDGPREVRKAMDRQHISVAPREAKTIKLADLIHNTSTIVQHDHNFARVYLGEKALLLTVLADGNPALYGRAYGLLVESEVALIQRALGGIK